MIKIKTRSKIFEYFLFFSLISFAAVLTVGERYHKVVSDGVLLWAAVIVPSLFPYFFITAVLSSLSVTEKIALRFSFFTKKVFNTGGITSYAFIMSLLSGFPVGAKLVSELYSLGCISETEALRASSFCATASPVFLISVVGKIMFDNVLFGVCLFAANLLSALFSGVLLAFYKRKEKPLDKYSAFFTASKNLLYDSVLSGVTSVLCVGGIIVIFYLLTEVLCVLKIIAPVKWLFSIVLGDKGLGSAAAEGLIECTRGLKTLSLGGIKFLSLPVAAATVGFGGFSVIAQSMAFLKKAKIKTAAFVLIKLLTAVIGFVFGIIFSLIFFY